ncbi:MAG: GNAT family N-acetyltransferase [Gordonia sp. (in: high G+C Gram-positive bacteria)]
MNEFLITPTVTTNLKLQWTNISDEAVGPWFADLAAEYCARYGPNGEFSGANHEDFAAPDGGLLLVLRQHVAVAGGGFRRLDPQTAEIKRIWTHRSHRRQGLARLVLDTLEEAAVDAGYRRLWLVTGPRQPEAKALYLANGYRALFDSSVDTRLLRQLAFEKDISMNR